MSLQLVHRVNLLEQDLASLRQMVYAIAQENEQLRHELLGKQKTSVDRSERMRKAWATRRANEARKNV